MTSIPHIGEILSLTSAMLWGLSVVFFKQLGTTISPWALNPFKNTVGMTLCIITYLALGEPFLQPIDSTGATGLTGLDYFYLTLSGIIGIGLADTIFFKSLNILGAGVSAIVDCLYSPSVILFAYFLIGERLGPLQLVGAGLVVVAVLFASLKIQNIDVTRKEFQKGVLLGVLAMGMMAFGIVLIKPVLNKATEDIGLQLWIAGYRLIPGVISSGLVFLYFNTKKDLIKYLNIPPEKISLEKGYSLYLLHVTDKKNIKLDFHKIEVF